VKTIDPFGTLRCPFYTGRAQPNAACLSSKIKALKCERMSADSHNLSSGISDDLAADDRELSVLCQTEIEPIIKRFICGKLHASLRPNDDSRNNQDALELAGEAKLLILQKLQHSNGVDPIRDLEAYVKTVTANVINQYLRRKYPRRLSLKNQFRYLFTHHPKLSIWRSDEHRWVCGYRGGNESASPIRFSDEKLSELKTRSASEGGNKASNITELAFGILDIHDSSIFLDDLVSLACEVLNIVEPAEVPELEDPRETVSRSTGNAHSTLEDEEFANRLWSAIVELPPRHRIALLLNFKDDSDNLIMMLPTMRAATIRDIADALGFGHTEFAGLLGELPWDDKQIAEHLEITRQQVINLRQSARQMLRRKLRDEN